MYYYSDESSYAVTILITHMHSQYYRVFFKGGACIVNEERRTVGTGSSDYPKGCNEKLWSSFQDDKQLVNPGKCDRLICM